MIYTDDTVKIAVPDVPQGRSAPLLLPAPTTAPQATQAMPSRSHEPITRLDGLLLHAQAQREFKSVMIWIFIMMLASASAITLILLLAH